jgi:hypothetical protein
LKSADKIAVYTVIIGPYDGLLPQPKSENVDYYCFTDQKFKSRTWKIIPVEIENEDPIRTARKLKILPHKILKDYQYSLFIDGNYLILKDITPLVAQVMRHGSIGIFDHNQCSDPRDCVYEEHEAIVRLQNRRGKLKDDPAIMDAQMEQYKLEQYPENNGLIFSAAIIRKHHDPLVIQTMELWYSQIQQFSRRDQLSFNYSAWKTGLAPYYIPGDLRRHEYFFLLSKHRKDYRWKYFKYRVKKLFGTV